MFDQYADKLPGFLRHPDPNIYLSDNYLVLDFETTVRQTKFSGKNKTPSAFVPDNNTVCVSYLHGQADREDYGFYFGGVFDHYDLIQRCYEADYIIMHNAKFDLQWLARAGLDLRKVLVADTMLAELVLTGNLKAGKKGALTLDALAKLYLGYGKRHYIAVCMENGVCPSEMPESLLQQRAVEDTQMTRDLWLRMRARLVKEKLLPVLFTRCIFTPVLADIEKNGVHLDKVRVAKEHEETKAQFDEVERRIMLLTEGRNPRSPPQMQEFIYDVLKFKAPKKQGKEWRPTGTDDILANLKPTTKKQKEFIALKQEFSKLAAALSKNLDYFYAVCRETDDALMYAQYNQNATVTHRLSSTGISTKFAMFDKPKSIQFQNMPRAYKKLISSRKEGWVVVEADGAQIEFRVAAFQGQDKVACQEIVNGFDVHLFTASQLNNIPIGEVTGDQRTAAKAETFKPLYGGQFGTEQQMAYYAAFRKKYTGICKWQKDNEAACLRNKRMKHVTGMHFYFPSCKLSRGEYNADWPSICNYPVQNLATAEIVPVAATYLWHVMGDMEAFMSNTVHDSVVSEAPKHELEQLYEYSNWAFLDAVYAYLELVYGLKFNVPLGLGFAAGTHWGAKGDDVVIPERKVMRMPPYRMAGVDYSALEETV